MKNWYMVFRTGSRYGYDRTESAEDICGAFDRANAGLTDKEADR